MTDREREIVEAAEAVIAAWNAEPAKPGAPPVTPLWNVTLMALRAAVERHPDSPPPPKPSTGKQKGRS